MGLLHSPGLESQPVFPLEGLAAELAVPEHASYLLGCTAALKRYRRKADSPIWHAENSRSPARQLLARQAAELPLSFSRCQLASFNQVHPVARVLIGLGVLLVVAGVLWQLGGRWLPLGRLPGDVVVERGNVRVYFPVVTCLIISVLLSVAAWLWRAWQR